MKCKKKACDDRKSKLIKTVTVDEKLKFRRKIELTTITKIFFITIFFTHLFTKEFFYHTVINFTIKKLNFEIIKKRKKRFIMNKMKNWTMTILITNSRVKVVTYIFSNVCIRLQLKWKRKSCVVAVELNYVFVLK